MKIYLLDIPVFYINMKKDVEKKNHIEKKLKQLGFTNVTRIDAVEDKKNGRVGLSKSQNMALSKVKPPFIILEDDADPKYFVKQIEVPDDADAVYLGNSQWGHMQSHSGFYLKYKPVENFTGVYRIYNMLASHAILYLTEDYVRMCQRTTKYCAEVNPLPMDVPFAVIQRYFNIYTINRPLFIQKDFPGKMTDAPKYTSSPLSSYKRYKSPKDRTGVYVDDQIINE